MSIPEIERSSPDEIKRFQDQKLKETLRCLYRNSSYYSRVFRENDVNIDAVSGLEDLIHLPVTTKNELQKYNDEFQCVDRSRIIDYSTTSGTLGEPVIFPLTNNDLDRLAYNEYLSLACTGGNELETYLLTTTVDRRFMAGMAYFLGARKLGAGIVRVGPGIPELQWDTIMKVKPTAIIAVPSFILALINYAEKSGIDFKGCSIQKAICIGEPIRNQDFSLNTLGRKIIEKWPLKLFSTYASTEMIAAFTECEYGIGGHHHPELIICEFLDEKNQPVPSGEAGELTITTIGVEGMPLLRFKTGDVCYHYTEPCQCGRTTFRLGPIIGRKQQMIKYKGTTLYPPALYDILDNIEGVRNYVVEVSTNDLGTDEILIRIGADLVNEGFEKEIKDHFRAKLRVSPSIAFSGYEEVKKILFPENARKPVKFIDRRTTDETFGSH